MCVLLISARRLATSRARTTLCSVVSIAARESIFTSKLNRPNSCVCSFVCSFVCQTNRMDPNEKQKPPTLDDDHDHDHDEHSRVKAVAGAAARFFRVTWRRNLATFVIRGRRHRSSQQGRLSGEQRLYAAAAAEAWMDSYPKSAASSRQLARHEKIRFPIN